MKKIMNFVQYNEFTSSLWFLYLGVGPALGIIYETVPNMMAV